MQRLTLLAVKGGILVNTNGQTSTTIVEGSFPGCTVSVFNTGTTNLATIFGDNLNPPTPKSNPFTADANGFAFFYATNGSRVDVQLSGTGIASPFVVAGDVLFNDPSTISLAAPVIVSFSATPAFDLSLASWFQMTLTGNVTAPTFINASAGNILVLSLIQDGTGGRTFAFPGSFLHPPTIDTTASSHTELTFKFDGTTWTQLGATADNTSVPGNLAVGGKATIGGTLAVTGSSTLAAVQITSENGLATVFADAFANVQAAINALPAAGGIVNATSPNCNLALGALNPGTRAVTLYLGPLSYTATQITLQTNLKIIGCGSANQTGSGQTKITSVGSNATNLMVIPQTSNTPVQGLLIQGIRFVGAAANTTQKGLFTDCSTLTNSGLWYSWIVDCEFDSFVGNPIHLQGRPDNATAVNQFLTFVNVRAFRAASGAEALRINGGVGQITFDNCEFDGPAISDSTAANIFIGQTAGGDTQSPYSIDFKMLTCQGSNLGVQLSGVQGVRFQHGHWENLHGAIQSSLVGTITNLGVIIEANDFFGTVGVNAGNGFVYKDNTTTSRSIFKNNLVEGTPDKIIIGTNLGSIDIINNPQTTSPPVWSSTNVTLGLGPAATINCQANRSVFINTGATNITTIQSSLGPGETITFRANGGPVFFTTGGNLQFGTSPVPFVLNTNEQATFVYDDADNLWNLQSWSHGATVVHLVAQAANIGSTTLYSVPSTPNRLYRIHSYIILTQIATVSSTLPSVVIGWTDKDNATALTFTATPTAPTGNTKTTMGILSLPISVAASSNITYSTTSYASSGATAMQYALVLSVEPL